MPEFALVDLAIHAPLIPIARAAAETILADLPADKPEIDAHELADKYRLLLSLFERDNAIKFLASG